MRSIQYLTLDINKRTQQTITANVGDVGSRFVKIQIVDEGKPINLIGVDVYLYALKSDNTKLFNVVVVEDDIDGIVLAELTSQLLVQPGNVKLTLVLIEGNNKLSSKEFTLNVENSIFSDEVIESTNEFGALTTSLVKVEEWNGYFKETSGQIEQKYTARLNTLSERFNTIININNNSPIPKTLTKLKANQDILIMFAGDSITEATQNTNTMETSYVACICRYLKELYPKSKIIRVDGKRAHAGNKPLETFEEVIVNNPTSPLNTITVVKSGVGGDTLLRLQKRMNDFIQYKGKNPDVIFMMEGINDSLTDDQTKYIPLDLYEKYYRTLIQYLKRETTSEIVLMTSHWHGDTPSNQYPVGKTYNLNHYIETQKKVALLEDLYIIDHKKVWDNHFVMSPYVNWGQGDWMTSGDATHPTPIGQEYGIAKTIWNEIFVNNQLLENKKDYYNYKTIKYDNPILKWTGTWNLQTTTSTNGNMTFKQKISSGSVGDTIKFTLKAKEINLLTKKGKAMGSADIYVNGTKVSSINNYTDYPIQDGTSSTAILGGFYTRENIINANNDKDYEVEIKVTQGYFVVYGVEYKTDYEYPTQFSGVVSIAGNGVDNYKSISIIVNNGVGNYILIPSTSNMKYKTAVVKNSSGNSFSIFVRKYDETVINTDETCDIFWIAIPN